jgi:hypothetical protein
MARAVIMSGAYEHNWKKAPGPARRLRALAEQAAALQLRLNNLSAAVIRPQLPELARRVRDGRRNHDHVAARLNASPWIDVPEKLAPENRAPDSIQFNLVGLRRRHAGLSGGREGPRRARCRSSG